MSRTASKPHVEEPKPKRAPRLPVSVRERRLQNPVGVESAKIDLKELGWTTYWANAARSADRIWQMKQKGWVDVQVDELADLDQVGSYTVQGGAVCRGERGMERLMKMPTADYKDIQMAKARMNTDMMRRGMQKQEVAQAVANKFGDQAGEFVGKTRMVGTITDNIERVHRDEEIG